MPVRDWKQCRSKVSASSSSMPVQAGAGDSWDAMACRECLSQEKEGSMEDVREVVRGTAGCYTAKLTEEATIEFYNQPYKSCIGRLPTDTLLASKSMAAPPLQHKQVA